MSSGISIESQGVIPVETPDFEVVANDLYIAAEAEAIRARIVTVIGGKMVKNAIGYAVSTSQEVADTAMGIRADIADLNEQSRNDGTNILTVERHSPYWQLLADKYDDIRLAKLSLEQRKALELYDDRHRYLRTSLLYRDVLLSGTSIADAVFNGNSLDQLLKINGWQKPFTENGGNIGDKKRAAFDKVVRRALELARD